MTHIENRLREFYTEEQIARGKEIAQWAAFDCKPPYYNVEYMEDFEPHDWVILAVLRAMS